MSERASLNALRRLSDEELARVAAGGDEAAARVLLERFEEPLHRYTVALVRDADLAREATWSALFEAARAVRMDDYSEPVKPWLFRVAHTAADVAGGRPNGRVDDDEAAAIAAAAGDEDRERLEVLLERLDGLDDRERGSLLLRELVGLEYTGIATVTGARASAARQDVFHARLAMQDDPTPTTDHCDEIRAAMSKAETGVRERRSIAMHLETCAVCEEFARQLETRRDDLRTLFPGPDEPLAAELVPPLPPIPGREQPTVAFDPLADDDDGDGERRRRRGGLLIPAVIVLALIGAGVATALILNDSGGGDKGKARAARETSLPGETTAPGKSEEENSKPGAAGEGSDEGSEGGTGSDEGSAGGSDEGSEGGTGSDEGSAGGSEEGSAGGADEGSGSAGDSGGDSDEGSGSEEGSAGASEGGSDEGSDADEGSGSAAGEGGGEAEGAEPEGEAGAGDEEESGEASTAGGAEESAGASETPGETAAGEAAAGAEAAQADENAVPRTGLDVALVVALGLLMLALGISVRRVYAEL